MAMTSEARPAPGFQELERRAERWRLPALSPELLGRMAAENARRREALLAEARRLEQRMAGAAEAGDLGRLEQLQRDFRLLRRSHAELEERGQRIENARQERILDDGMARALGGRGRVRLLEAGVLVLIVLVLGLLGYELLNPGLPLATLQTFFWIDTACCLVFLVEFALRYRQAESKGWFLRHYWVDLVTSIPVPPSGMVLRTGRLFRVARILRVARLARFLRVLRAIRLLLFFWRGMDKLTDVLDVRLMKKSLMLGAMVLVLGGLAIYGIEGQSESVGSLPEAVWWSFTTVVTGGYGDIHNPLSVPGRLVTVLLVIAGMIIVGVFTATLTALLVGDEAAEMEQLQRELGEALAGLGARVDALAERIDGAEAGAGDAAAGPAGDASAAR